MSFSVSSVVTRCRECFSDMTDEQVLRYLNEARPLILNRFKQRRTSRNINLTASTQTYASASIAHIDEVRYRRSAEREDYSILRPISKDEILSDHPHWGKLENGEPRYYYLETGTTGPLIGFHPIPETTTSGGYPVVQVFSTDVNTLTAIDTIYDEIPDPYLYVSAICLRHARSKWIDKVPFWEGQHKAALAEANEFIVNKQGGNEGFKIKAGFRRFGGPI